MITKARTSRLAAGFALLAGVAMAASGCVASVEGVAGDDGPPSASPPASAAASGDGDDASEAPESATGADDADSDEGVTADDTDAPEGNAQPDSGTASGDASCVVGTWTIDTDKIAQMVSERGGGEVTGIDGTISITFGADGTATSTFDDFEMSLTAEGQKMKMGQDGSDSGTYSIDGDTLSMSLTEHNTTAYFTIGGQKVSADTDDTPNIGVSSGTFTCGGDTMTITSSGSTTLLHRR